MLLWLTPHQGASHLASYVSRVRTPVPRHERQGPRRLGSGRLMTTGGRGKAPWRRRSWRARGGSEGAVEQATSQKCMVAAAAVTGGAWHSYGNQGALSGWGPTAEVFRNADFGLKA